MSLYVAAYTFLKQSGAHFTFDEFSERPFVQASFVQDGAKRALDDRVLGELRHFMAIATDGIDPGRDNICQAATQLSYEHAHNSVRDYLEGVQNTKKVRLGGWLLKQLGAEDCPLNRNTIKRFFVSAVARVFEPGVRANLIPILSGPQRAGKTSFLRIIARDPSLFTDAPILRLDPQRRQEVLRGKHIVEIAELDGWRSATVEHLKALTSATHDYGRRVWGTLSIDQARRCVFACTTNEISPLRDSTGNGRFPVIRVQRIALNNIARHTDELWADAKALYDAGYSIDLPNKLAAAARAEESARMEDDPWVDALASLRPAAVINGKQRASYAHVLAHLGLSVGRVSQSDARRAAEAMSRNGWNAPVPCKLDGKTVRCFERRVENKEGE